MEQHPEPESEVVLVERLGHAMLLTINRPEVRNAVNMQVALALGAALDEADGDPAVRVVVLTGAGDTSFCAGADLKELARGVDLIPSSGPIAMHGFAGYVAHSISKPTIAAVNGFALGGGTEIVLASDLAVAAQNASFGLPEVSRGLVAAAGGAFRLVRQVAPKAAMEMLLTGRSVSADEALALGLVNRVVENDRLLPTALAMAEIIAGNAPLAVQSSKRIARGIRNGRISDELNHWALSQQERDALRTSEDAKEGARAFTEKRSPVWSGR